MPSLITLSKGDTVKKGCRAYRVTRRRPSESRIGEHDYLVQGEYIKFWVTEGDIVNSGYRKEQG